MVHPSVFSLFSAFLCFLIQIRKKVLTSEYYYKFYANLSLPALSQLYALAEMSYEVECARSFLIIFSILFAPLLSSENLPVLCPETEIKIFSKILL